VSAPFLIKDINPGRGCEGRFGSEPSGGVRVEDAVFFRACGRLNEGQTWKTDGRPEGTVQVSEIPRTDDEPFFFVEQGQLWTSDGTGAGTISLGGGDPRGGSPDSFKTALTRVNDLHFFTICGLDSGCELWRSDGTVAGTKRMAMVIPPDEVNDGSKLAELTPAGDGLFFAACEVGEECDLWWSDGTEAGTVPVTHFDPSPYDPDDEWEGPRLAAVNGTVFFRHCQPDRNRHCDLWRSDRTLAGTVQVSDVNLAGALTRFGDLIFFTGGSASPDLSIWRSDGTTAGTFSLGIRSKTWRVLTEMGETAIMRVYDPARDTYQLWRSDGTEDGTFPLTDFDFRHPGFINVDILAEKHGTLLLAVDDEVVGKELFGLALCGGEPGPCDPVTGECAIPPWGCDDGDPCTVDACNPGVGCTHEPMDGCPATSTSTSSTTTTSSSSSITTTTTLPGQCSGTLDGSRCDDGSACTGDDACTGGACVGGASTDCDDGDPCTSDTCDPGVGCIFVPTPGSCDESDEVAPDDPPVGLILADVSVLKEKGRRTFGDEHQLWVDRKSPKQTFIRVQVAGLGDQPAGAATLRLRVAGTRDAASKAAGRIHLMVDCSWDEDTTTWKNRPAFDGEEPLDTQERQVVRGETVDFDVVEAIVGDGVYCFAMDSESSDGVEYYSREAGARGPELLVSRLDPAARVGVVVADASVFETAPDRNLGQSPLLWADRSSVKRTFFRVKVRDFDANSVRDVRLRLQVSDERSASGPCGRLYQISDCSWSEMGVTYDTQPDIDGALLDELDTVVETGNVIEFNITRAITGDGVYCFALEGSSRNGVIYRSREAASNGPVVITTSEPSVTSRLTDSVTQRQGNLNGPGSPAISADGRFVAFVSNSPDLDPRYPNELADVFVHDRLAETVEQVSVDSLGTGGNDRSNQPVISADGRFVAFRSKASNLVADDTGDNIDVFVHDRQQRTTERVSVNSFGLGGDSHSGSNLPHAMSADGRFVAFDSRATNLVSNDTNDWTDVFVHDRYERTTERVSTAADDYQRRWRGVAISADGRFVVFTGHQLGAVCASCESPTTGPEAVGRLEVFVHDRHRQTTELVKVSVHETSLADVGLPRNLLIGWSPALSADGQVVAVATPLDVIFVHDRRTGLTRVPSIPTKWEGDESERPSNGTSFGHPETLDRHHAISADGRFLVASTGRRIHVHDLLTGTTRKLADGKAPAISHDGRLVAFASEAQYLVPGPASSYGDMFVRVR
jgi:ELWxxDGT repeat protein